MRRRMMVCATSLPYDEELVCLTSNGYQYLDTLLTLSNTDEVKVTGTAISHAGSDFYGIFGSRSSATSRNFSASFNGDSGSAFCSVDFNKYPDYRASTELSATYPCEFSISDSATERIVTFGGYSASNATASTDSFTTPTTCKIFKMDGGGANAVMSLKTFVITGRMNLTSVLKNGVPCAYDSESNSFLYNQVSGHQFGYTKKDGTVVAPT